MVHKDIAWEDVDCIHVAQNKGQWRAVVNREMNLRVSQKVEHFLTSSPTVSFSRRTMFHSVRYQNDQTYPVT
jgi:hypothetical protein